MKTYLIAFLLPIIGALFATPFIGRLAKALRLIDLPDARKVHATPVPRVGGLAIAIPFFLIVSGIFIFDPPTHKVLMESPWAVAPILMGAAGFLLLGLMDDVWTLRPQIKLVILLGIAAAVCAAGIKIDVLSLGSRSWVLGWASWPVTILWIVAITIAINFVDGLDGLAAGIVAIAAAVIALAEILSTNHDLIAIPALALVGSLLGFLAFNFHPATIFMGDCGSLFIGFLLATLSLRCGWKPLGAPYPPTIGDATLGMAVTVLALSVPLLDTVFTFVRRSVLQRRSMFASERGHIHHHLLQLGLKHHQAVLLLYGVTLVAAASGLVLLFRGHTLHMLILAAVLALAPLLLFKFTGYVRFDKILAAVRRNSMIGREEKNYRAAFEQMQLRFSVADSFERWWTETCNAAEMMDVVRISLPLPSRNGTTQVREWERAGFDGKDTLRLAIPIQQRRVGGPLRVNVEVDATDSLEAAGRRLTFFARLMEEHSIVSLPETTGRSKAAATPAPAMAESARPRKPAATMEPTGPRGQTAATGTRIRTAMGARTAAAMDISRRRHVCRGRGWRSCMIFCTRTPAQERVLEQILNVFPQADLFSLFDFLPADQRDFIQNKKVTTSFIQGLPFARKKHRSFLPLMPLAIEQLDVSRYDIVISSSYAVAKGVITRPDQLHICYCHTPIRYAWDLQHQYLRESGLLGLKSLLPRAILHYMRNWDARSAAGVDVFLTNSDFVGKRIQKFYRRNSKAVYPPVDTHGFTLETQKEDYYVTASRFVPYKRIDLIVDAFAQMPERRLFVIGDGPMFDKVKAKAGPNTKLMGYQPTERMRALIQRARGFVFAAEEDFGIVPVEAQACGTPVIAFGRGGTSEAIVENVTGILFDEQSVPSLTAAVKRFETMTWDPVVIRKHAERFSSERFRAEFGDIVTRAWMSFCHGRQMMADPLLRALEANSEVDYLGSSASNRAHSERPELYEMRGGPSLDNPARRADPEDVE